MDKVVVTGATGMIGVALIKECIKNGVQVLAIVRRNSRNLSRLPVSDLVKVWECNLDELENAQFSDSEKKYDVFYHFGWDHTSKEHRDNPELQEKNIKYTLDAVKLAHRLGCEKFVGAGSQAEYGPTHSVISPDTRVEPAISYGIAKYAAGKLSGKLCAEYGMLHVWGRIFSVYGCLDHESTMLMYAIDRYLKKEPAKFSAGDQMWDYLHEADAGRIFYLLGERVRESKVYCIANGNSRPLREFILELREIMGPDFQCEFSPAQESKNTVSLQVDTTILEQDTGYIPQVSFAEGIREIVEDRKHQGE